MLINTTTGRLCNRVEQASTFESLPTFKELVSLMMTRIDYVWIKHEVRLYFRYVMLSHTWEDNEPLFEKVLGIMVTELEESPTHNKLRMFCKIVGKAGFNWAWSDTCCINKSDPSMLQEALAAMFKWYEGSAMMIIFLRGVCSSSQHGALAGSKWNTHGWTLQEYFAAKIIQFHTEDWTLYLDLELPNHKESPDVIWEMEQATRVSAQQLMMLRPGISNIQEKLCLTSTRQTTRVEDAAWSLLGIFSVTGIIPAYGEEERTLGLLLANVLARSRDVSILAWTGESGRYNSSFPAHINVFNQPATSHLPPPIDDAKMERIITTLYSSFDLNMALRLYNCLDKLPSPLFAANRMELPCITFELPSLLARRTSSGHVYRVNTRVFGMVDITTRYNLSRMKSLYLVHPWLDTLLEREEMQNDVFVEDDIMPPSPTMDDEEICGEELDNGSWSLPEFLSLPDPLCMVPMDRETRA